MSTSSKEKNASIINFIYDSYQITRSVKLFFINQWINEYNQQLRFVNIPRWIFEKKKPLWTGFGVTFQKRMTILITRSTHFVP